MKTISTIFTLVLLIILTSTSTAQINWTKYGNNPVLNVGPAGSWDDQFVGNCSVIFDSSTSTFKMWYNGGDGEKERKTGR